MLRLHWIKCSDGEWCDLLRLDLSDVDDIGVYLIYHGGQNSRCVRVGSGTIKERLAAHQNDPNVRAYRHLGLYVTWAAIHPSQQLGVEAYLAEACNPLVGERFPDRTPIPVNLPK